MYSILEEFAYGNVSPQNQYIKQGSKLHEAMHVVSTNEENLLSLLSEKEKSIFKKYVEAQSELNMLTAVKNMIYGYKLGLLMTSEAFLTGGSLIDGYED